MVYCYILCHHYGSLLFPDRICFPPETEFRVSRMIRLKMLSSAMKKTARSVTYFLRNMKIKKGRFPNKGSSSFFDCLMRTCLTTVATPDTLCTVWMFPYFNVQFADLLTGFAAGTGIPVNGKPLKGDWIKPSINGSQRTDIMTKRTGHQNGQQNQHH